MSQREEVEKFRLKFNTQYQSSLGFQPVEFEETINSVLKCPVEERGILAIYLHNENHVAADKFAEQITRAQIAEYLNENFIIWGFDSNAECIQQLLKDNLINYDLRANNMPVLLIVVRFNDTNEIISTITVETNQMLAELENCYEEFSRRKAELLRQVDLRDDETPEDLIENEEQERRSIDIFGMQFNNRYNVNLRFLTTTFNETVNNVLKCSIADRGVLAIYLHDYNHVFVHLFAKRIAESQIAEYLNEHFNIYGFDCTSQNNKNYMLQLLRKNLINYDLKRNNVLPVLLIVGRFNGSNQIMTIITVNTRNIRERLENSNNEFESRNAENYSFR